MNMGEFLRLARPKRAGENGSGYRPEDVAFRPAMPPVQPPAQWASDEQRFIEQCVALAVAGDSDGNCDYSAVIQRARQAWEQIKEVRNAWPR